GFYELATARPYNPASRQFDGPEYTLTAPDGTIYHLSTAGGVEEQILPGGGRLYFSANSITSSTGEVVQFVRNASGAVTTLLAAGLTDRFAFALQASEIRSTASGFVYLGVQVQADAGQAFQPDVPSIAGLTPLIQQTSSGSSFALFAVKRDGLRLLEVTGANS